MKRNLLAFILLCSTFTLGFAAIPQVEKDALYAISTSVKNVYNWNEETPVEQWTGVTITNVEGIDHVTGLAMNVTKNGDNYTIDFSNSIADLIYLENFNLLYRFTTPINFNFDFNHLVGLNRLATLEVARAFTVTNNDLIKNADQLPLLMNLENLTLQFDSPTFKIPANIASNLKLKKFSYINFQDQTYAPQIFNTLSLEELTLQTNVFEVPLSTKAVANMTKLKALTLQGNYYSLPIEFYAIPNLESLSINSKNYSLSPEIGNYKDQLKNFKLQQDYGINNDEIGMLVGLESLYLSSSGGFITLKSYISNLTKLKSLTLIAERFILIPNEISQLTNLEKMFYHTFQPLTNLSLYNIPNLKFLGLYTGENISENISNLSKLEHLQVVSNGSLNKFPLSLKNTSTLKKLDFLTSNRSAELSIPLDYFSNWPALQQFWTQIPLKGNITNQFLNNPNLENLILNPVGNTIGTLEGKLNLCQNPKLYDVTIYRNNITEVDLRNIAGLATNTTDFFYFRESKVSKFIVDDVDQFNSLVSSGKIKIQTSAPGGYTVETSAEACQKALAQSNVQLNKTMLYPNPVKDVLTFKTDKNVENVEVFSVTGQKLNVDFYRNTANLSTLPAGIYMIKWSEGGIYKIDKIIKE